MLRTILAPGGVSIAEKLVFRLILVSFNNCASLVGLMATLNQYLLIRKDARTGIGGHEKGLAKKTRFVMQPTKDQVRL